MRFFAAPVPASPAIDMASLWGMQRRTTRALRSPLLCVRLNLRALMVVVVVVVVVVYGAWWWWWSDS